MSNKKHLLVIALLFFSLTFSQEAYAQEPLEQASPSVDYKGQPVVDTDLDGLTDEGEKQIYHTSPSIADNDGDGFSDGVEVVAGTNPLYPNLYPGMVVPLQQNSASGEQETPWAWYSARLAGLVSFLLLYISIFLGLTLRIPYLRKIFSPLYSLKAHCWISLCALLFALSHGAFLTFDKTINFTLVDIFVPFASKYQTNMVALGTFAFYLMLILVVTSYGKRFISQKLWRITHFSNIILYIIGIVHAVKLGTDLKNTIVFDIFLWANAFLVLIMLYNIEIRISEALRRRAENNEPPVPPVQTI